MRIFFTSIIYILIISTNYAQQITVCINAGHGGKDPGKLSSSKKYLDEKDLNLKISTLVANYIDSLIPGVKVIQTRKTDVFHSLNDIVYIANSNNADFLISIHVNSSEKSNVKGTSVHVHNSSSIKGVRLATYINRDLNTRARRSSRGVKTKEDRSHNLQILQQTKMPAVLVECGFITNKQDEQFLNTTHGQEIIASSIYRGFKAFLLNEYPNRLIPNIYKIQLASSYTKISKNYYYFNKLTTQVEEIDHGKKEKFRFVYYTGNFFSKKEAIEYLSEVRKIEGFKDAYVVSLEL